MDSKVGNTQLQTLLSYDEFEPLCTWQREDGQDILVLHLPEFKKDQLRIQISNTGILKITGERLTDGKKQTRFQKEVKVTKDYDSSNIHAKFSQGRLRITLPKKTLTPLVPKPPSAMATSSPQDGNNNASEKTDVSNTKTKINQFLRSRKFTNIAVNIGFVMIAAFSAYVVYKYWTMYVQVDED